MAASLTTVVIGTLSDDRRDAIRLAALRAKAEPSFYVDAVEGRRGLKEAQSAPRCIFIDGATPGLESFVAWVRGEARLFSVPVVVLTAAAADQSYTEAHAWGADDVQAGADLGGMTRRLANLSEFDPSVRPPITQGRAVIAHENESRRRVLGRILRQGGFDVSFAADRDELANVSLSGNPPSLLVCAEKLGTETARSSIEKTRRVLKSDTVPAVVLATRTESRVLAHDVSMLGATGVTSESAPADNLLFIANELLRPDVHNLRASPRLLFSSICAFRRGGVFEPVFGLTYNISREGLYIRTLDPPTRGTLLWFEMRPPHGTAAVHLRANVVWCRGLTSPGGAAPSGFGVRIQEDACPPGDLAAYREAYDAIRSGGSAH